MSGEKRIKCDGRFSEFRKYLFNDAIPLVFDGSTNVSREDLKELWSLVEGDVYSYDLRDPYFESRTDSLRKIPAQEYHSLVPLFPESYKIDDEVVAEYLESQGNSYGTIKKVLEFTRQPANFFRNVLDYDPKNIIFEGGANLGGYSFGANNGIGTISLGGISGGGLRSDSPFLLEIYKKGIQEEKDLVGVVGFWPQENSMLISQMQSCKNAKFPKGVQFGVGCLRVAETFARESGFEKILLYNAKAHPIFKEHSDSWNQLAADFTAIWDGSAKKLGYDGSRNQHYEKDLRQR